jgi:hypothetical protein
MFRAAFIIIIGQHHDLAPFNIVRKLGRPWARIGGAAECEGR